MLREGRILGVFMIARRMPRPFTDKQIELVTTFADQAVIAIENVRLFDEVQARTAELQESLEYQTATSDVLNVISRSPSDLQPVLGTIVETAGRLCEADYAMALRLNDDKFSLAAIHGAPPEYVEYLRNNPPALDPSTCSGRTALERRAVYIEDTLTEPGYKRRAAAEIGNYRTIFGVPLLREGEVIGVICLVHKTIKAFNCRQIELVTTFADQAVIAIENVRLFDEVQARTREVQEALDQQTATSEVLQVISRSKFDLQPVLDAIVESANRLCEADGANIWRPKDGGYYSAASYGMAAEFKAKLKNVLVRPAGKSIVARALRSQEVIHIPDIAFNSEYFGVVPENLGRLS